MMTTLADNETIIQFAGERLILRPTLLAAMRLEKRFGGFHEIIRGVAEQNTGVMSALVSECSRLPNALADFIDYDTRKPMAYKLGALVEPLTQLVLQLAGITDEELENGPDDTDEKNRRPYAEHFARLFAIGTGYLGWTPDETWNATPAEIKAAYAGRLELLKAIFGASEDQPANKTSAPMSDASLLSFLQARAA